jgi:hypothetical protein
MAIYIVGRGNPIRKSSSSSNSKQENYINSYLGVLIKL